MTTLSEDAINWLAGGERGVSSNSIFQVLTGYPALKSRGRGRPPDIPHDPDDLRRCLLLLEAVPELAPRIGEMAKVSPEWAAMSARWDEVVCMFVAECAPQGGWKNGQWRCPLTYRLMREIIDGARGNKYLRFS